MNEKNSKFMGIGLIALAAIILILGAVYFIVARNKMASANSPYQAVFLTNGQVYFGTVSDKDDLFVKLTNIYYLQMKQPLQNQNQDVLNQPDLTLIKLGNELHGPADMMQINREQILFIEDLKPDSKVVQAIQKYQTGK